MIDIVDHAEGCVLRVRAQPGARRNGVTGVHAGMLKVSVTAPPDKGRANEAILNVLADALGLKRSQVELINGHGSRQKQVLLRGITVQNAQRKVQEIIKI